MNSGFAVAAVTVALADRLHAFIGDAVPGARVTTLNPGSDSLRGGEPIVNLYLFRTVRNGFVSNDDLPTRGPDGRPLHSPVLKLALDYMITFFGDDSKLDPQRLLGPVVGGLNADPYVGREALRATIASTPWLSGGDDQSLPNEPIRVTPLDMSPDNMARLWSEFIHVPYQLTQLYTVTPVTLETVLPVEPVLPVRRIGLGAFSSRTLVITALVNAADPALPISGGGSLGIRLANPGQPDLVVKLNGVAAKGVKTGFDADGFSVLLVELDADQPAGLQAGQLNVQVVLTRPDGSGIVAQSQTAQTRILPGLAQPPAVADGQLKAVMALPVPPGAAASFLLFPRGAAQLNSRRIACLPRTAASAELVAPLAGVAAGQYLVSVELDGVASLLDYAGDTYSGPLVSVPAGN